MFNYFGSKGNLASSYQPPTHDLIIEPFAGAARYAVAWLEERPSTQAIVFDVDPMVIKSWKRLLDASPDEIMEWTLEVGEPVKDYIDLANGGDGHITVNERMVKRFYDSKPRWARQRASIGNRLEVIEGDYREAPHIEATWFIDPPYQQYGHRYQRGSGAIDYDELAAYCKTRHGQVIVCEQSPAEWMPFQVHKTVNTQGGRGTELVWYNQVDPTLLDLIQ